MSRILRTILWRRIDLPGFDSAQLLENERSFVLRGNAVFSDEGEPCNLRYEVTCSQNWMTLAARVAGWRGAQGIEFDIQRKDDGSWAMNGNEVAGVARCTDIDLSFTPATNLLPLRRLQPTLAETVEVRSAWFRFPELTLEPLEQTYTRSSETKYGYTAFGGDFTAEIETDPFGIVTSYSGLWIEVGDASQSPR